jgi:hypothetical protein
MTRVGWAVEMTPVAAETSTNGAERGVR